jgi:hypothetical protein
MMGFPAPAGPATSFCEGTRQEIRSLAKVSDEWHAFADQWARLRGEVAQHSSGTDRNQEITAICDEEFPGWDKWPPNRISLRNPATYASLQASRIHDYGLDDP